MSSETVLDLHELATIFLYEALSTKPRFRHAKLIEVEPHGAFRHCVMDIWSPEWHQLGFNRGGKSTSIGYMLEKPPSGEAGERDTPSNIIDASLIPASKVMRLTEDDKELIYHQIRLHASLMPVQPSAGSDPQCSEWL
jgi:hypothetical protein